MPITPPHQKDTRDICADISVTFSGTGQITQAIINDFDLCASTTTIIIEGYSSIGQRAFYNRTSLTSIIIPNSVTSIGQNAFLESGVTTVSIANGQVISGTTFVSPATNVSFFGRPVTTILAGTFNGTGELTQEIVNAGLGSATTVIIEGYSSIGPHAFQGSTSLTSVTIGNSVQTISTGAFFGCNKLTSVTIPNSVLTIDTRAFFGCNKLTSVTIPASVTTFVDGDTFQGCSKLQSITVYKNNANYSSLDGVLFNKDKTTLVSFPGGRVGSYTIPNSVLRIGSYAFAEAILTSVIIPNSVTNIGTSAFLESGVTTVSIANGQVISGTTFVSPATNVTFFGRSVVVNWPHDAPVITNVSYIQDFSRVSFTQNNNGLGLDITGYSYSIDNGQTYTNTNVTSSPLLIPGLRKGVTHEIILKAKNGLDSSPSSVYKFTYYVKFGKTPQ